MQNKKMFTLILSFAATVGCASGGGPSANPSDEPASTAAAVLANDGAADAAAWGARAEKSATRAQVVDLACDIYASLDISQDGTIGGTEAGKIPSWLQGARKDAAKVSIADFVAEANKQFTAYAKENPKVLNDAEFRAMEAGKK